MAEVNEVIESKTEEIGGISKIDMFPVFRIEFSLYKNLCLLIVFTYLSQFFLCSSQFHFADITCLLTAGIDTFHTGDTFLLIRLFWIFD